MLPPDIIYATIFASIFGYFFYVKDIFAGKTKPNLVSWLLWMPPPLIGVFFQLKAGAGLSVLPVFMAGFWPLLIIIVSVCKKNAYWKLNNFDLICGAFSLFALALYILTHNLGISISFAIVSDALAFIPTYRKTWKFPESETAVVYWITLLNNILGLLIIKNWSFTVYSFGLYLVIFNVIMIFILYHKKITAIFS